MDFWGSGPTLEQKFACLDQIWVHFVVENAVMLASECDPKWMSKMANVVHRCLHLVLWSPPFLVHVYAQVIAIYGLVGMRGA